MGSVVITSKKKYFVSSSLLLVRDPIDLQRMSFVTAGTPAARFVCETGQCYIYKYIKYI